ncbi:TPA: hypothetical protein NV714_003788 [Escherichia coli]|nr:hypothetical protein [Escherichia coli]
MTGQLTLYPRPEGRGFTVRFGKLISFDSKFVTFKNELNEEIEFPIKEYKEKTRSFVEYIEDLSFAVITKRN